MSLINFLVIAALVATIVGAMALAAALATAAAAPPGNLGPSVRYRITGPRCISAGSV